MVVAGELPEAGGWTRLPDPLSVMLAGGAEPVCVEEAPWQEVEELHGAGGGGELKQGDSPVHTWAS